MNTFIDQAAKVRKHWQDLSTNWNDLFLLNALEQDGLQFPEINAYLNMLYYVLFYDGGAVNYQNYVDIMIAQPGTIPVTLPLNPDGSFAIKMNIKELVSQGKNLDLFFANNNVSALSARLYYENGTAPYDFTITGFTALSDKVYKKTLQLSTLPAAAQIKEIEFRPPFASGAFYAVPENSIFKAYSYLPDGNAHFTFGNTGRYQSIFYNQSGELTYTKDSKGNVLTVDSTTLAGTSSYLENLRQVVVGNQYPSDWGNNDLSAPRIQKITFMDATDAAKNIDFETLVTPGQVAYLKVPHGAYHIVVTIDRPSSNISIGGTVYQIYPGVNSFDATISPSSQPFNIFISQ